MRDRNERARRNFKTFAAEQKIVGKKTQWLHFGATQPGIVPAGTNGASRDLHVYENVVAVIETDGKHGQLPIGTLVKVGEAWRAIGGILMGIITIGLCLSFFTIFLVTRSPGLVRRAGA